MLTTADASDFLEEEKTFFNFFGKTFFHRNILTIKLLCCWCCCCFTFLNDDERFAIANVGCGRNKLAGSIFNRLKPTDARFVVDDVTF